MFTVSLAQLRHGEWERKETDLTSFHFQYSVSNNIDIQTKPEIDNRILNIFPPEGLKNVSFYINWVIFDLQL